MSEDQGEGGAGNVAGISATDITGVAGLANSKLVNELYGDALKPATQDVGSLLHDAGEAVQLFLGMPFRLASTAARRFEPWLNEIISGVPAEHRKPAPAQIVVQALVDCPRSPDDWQMAFCWFPPARRPHGKEVPGDAQQPRAGGA